MKSPKTRQDKIWKANIITTGFSYKRTRVQMRSHLLASAADQPETHHGLTNDVITCVNVSHYKLNVRFASILADIIDQ